MDERHVTDHLVAYVSGNLDAPTSELVRGHLESCTACRQELDGVRTLWEDLGRVPDPAPPRSLARRFRESLATYQQDLYRHRTQEEGNTHMPFAWWPRPAFEGAIALLLLGIGFIGGHALRSGSDEITALHGEVRELRALLTVSLLQQATASERLKGIGLSTRIEDHDRTVTATLVDIMNHDRNVNVRLAALDALSEHLGLPEIRAEIVRTMPAQSSPLMQAAVVDLLVQMNDASAKEALHRARITPGLDPAIKSRIDQGMQMIL
jgi:hypothetical protein